MIVQHIIHGIELLVDNPGHYVFSPDGRSAVIGFSSYGKGQAHDYMGP